MSLSTQVQFVRNFVCVLQALLPVDHSLNAPVSLVRGQASYETPSLIEYVKAVTQFAAVVFNTHAGIRKLYHSAVHTRDAAARKRDLDRLCIEDPSPEHLIVAHRIHGENAVHNLNYVSGVADLIIGASFMYLSCNSLHIRGADHPKPLMDAVYFSLLPIGYYVVLIAISIYNLHQEAQSMRLLSAALQEVDEVDAGDNMSSSLIIKMYESGFSGNLSLALQHMDPSYAAVASCPTDVATDLEKVSASIARVNTEAGRASAATRLQALADYSSYQIGLDIILFLLNLGAWYGYLVASLVYYIPESSQPVYLQMMKLSHSHSSADWWGNFGGDLLWTIEPFIILVCVPLIQSMHIDATTTPVPVKSVSLSGTKKSKSRLKKAKME
jgi:hypothetical protein